MKFRSSQMWPLFHRHSRLDPLPRHHLCFTSFLRNLKTTTRASFNGGGTSNSEGNSFIVPGATMATILMLGILHARRLYDDKKVEEAREKGFEPEFSPDAKAAFLKLLPLRSISRFWGFMADMEIPIWLRPYIYKGWARAFHSNLEETALPLSEYATLREFFARTLKEGSRHIDPDSHCLISPVDGIILKFGELKESSAMIEQVKGFSYPASSLLGSSSFLPMTGLEDMHEQPSRNYKSISAPSSESLWWQISFGSPKVQERMPICPMKGVFYCVIYLRPGDYHRVHSRLIGKFFFAAISQVAFFPLNERATRTIRNLHVENERVVLEGKWAEGYMAIAAIGATNVGSIQLSIEPELRTNRPRKKLLHSEPPDERVYEPEGVGITIKKGDEVAAFNMGSTVVLVFHAPVSKSAVDGVSSNLSSALEAGIESRWEKP